MKSKKKKSFLKKAWYFIWKEDSLLSWIVNIILAFIIVKFLFYPGLSLILGTELPLVAVVSPSMEHRISEGFICGSVTKDSGRLNLQDWWFNCGSWYEFNTNISLNDFGDFPLKNGFNKGDLILLRSPKNLKVGDVIVFNAQKQYPIIHRIIFINDSVIMTKGDNNPGLIKDSQLNEENISFDLVVGKAYAKIPYFGYIKIWFTDLILFFRN